MSADIWKLAMNDRHSDRTVRVELEGFGFSKMVDKDGYPDFELLEKDEEYQRIIRQVKSFSKRVMRRAKTI